MVLVLEGTSTSGDINSRERTNFVRRGLLRVKGSREALDPFWLVIKEPEDNDRAREDMDGTEARRFGEILVCARGDFEAGNEVEAVI